MTHFPERRIRLKEHHRGQRWEATPSDLQRDCSDESLGVGPFVIQTDSDGFIASAFDRSPANDDIVILGDSIPENTFVSEDKRFCRVVESALHERGHRVRILNGGVSGATTLHTLNLIATKIVPLRPKLVVVMNGTIDAECVIEAESFWCRNEYYDPFSYGYVDTERPFVSRPRAPNYDDRARLLRTMVFLMQQFHLQIAFATSHQRGWEGDELMQRLRSKEGFLERSARWQGVHDATREVAAEIGAPLLDINKQFNGRTDLLYDDIHMNERGSSEIGEWVAQQLHSLMLRRPHASSRWISTQKSRLYKILGRSKILA